MFGLARIIPFWQLVGHVGHVGVLVFFKGNERTTNKDAIVTVPEFPFRMPPRLPAFHRLLAIAARPVPRQPLRLMTSVSASPPIRSITRAHSLMSGDVKTYDESATTVRINDKDDGEEFVCDEEPHMLTPEQGYGFYPITLGQLLHDGKLEIVRKLGWAGYSSVWLARSVA